MMTPADFVSAVASLEVPAAFNPYSERCPVHDRADAPQVRRANLLSFLEVAIASRADTIWIARDLGYRGGRRTGVPLTDEIHLEQMRSFFESDSFQRATCGPVVAERTAAMVWSAIRVIQQPVFLWNVFPLHPHEPDDPFSNRCHTRAEREASKPLLLSLLEMIQPRQVVAIGRDAQDALAELGLSATGVRHPSYGGQSEFMAGVYSLYNVCPVRQISLPLASRQSVEKFDAAVSKASKPIRRDTKGPRRKKSRAPERARMARAAR